MLCWQKLDVIQLVPSLSGSCFKYLAGLVWPSADTEQNVIHVQCPIKPLHAEASSKPGLVIDLLAVISELLARVCRKPASQYLILYFVPRILNSCWRSTKYLIKTYQRQTQLIRPSQTALEGKYLTWWCVLVCVCACVCVFSASLLRLHQVLDRFPWYDCCTRSSACRGLFL